MGVLTVTGIAAGYSAADEVLKDLDFIADDSEIVCVIGPNGAGKSTLLRAIAGLLRPSRGSIVWNGQSLTDRTPAEIARLGVAYVPQEHNIFATMSVRENLEIGGYVDPAATPARIAEVMERFPLSISVNSAMMRQLPPLRYVATAWRCASIPSPLLACFPVETR